MMIKVIPSRSAKNSCAYIQKTSSRPIGGNLGGSSPGELAMEFRFLHDANPVLKHEVIHIILALPHGEHLDDAQWQEAMEVTLEGLGYGDCGWTARAHADREHEHVHLLVSPLDFEGRRIDRGGDRFRCKRIARALERRFGLQEVPNFRVPRDLLPPPRLLAVKPPPGVDLPSVEKPGMVQQLRDRILDGIRQCSDFRALAQHLRRQGIEMAATVSKAGKITGMGYRLLGGQHEYLNASAIDESFSFVKLQKKHHLDFDPARDLPWLRPGALPVDREEVATLFAPSPGTPPRLVASMAAMGQRLLNQWRRQHVAHSQFPKAGEIIRKAYRFLAGRTAILIDLPRPKAQDAGADALRRKPGVLAPGSHAPIPDLRVVDRAPKPSAADPFRPAQVAGGRLSGTAMRLAGANAAGSETPSAGGTGPRPGGPRPWTDLRADLDLPHSGRFTGSGVAAAPSARVSSAWGAGEGRRHPERQRTRIPGSASQRRPDAVGGPGRGSATVPDPGSTGVGQPRLGCAGGWGCLCGRPIPAELRPYVRWDYQEAGINPPQREGWRQPALSLALPLVEALSGVQSFEAEPMPLAQFRVEAWQAAGMEGLDRRAFRGFREQLDKCRLGDPGCSQGEEPSVHLPGLAGSLAPARRILADLASIAKQGTRRVEANPALPEEHPSAPKGQGKALNALPIFAARPSAEMGDFMGIWIASGESRAIGKFQMDGQKRSQFAQHTRMASMLASTAAPSTACLEDFGIHPLTPSEPLPVMDRAVSDAREIPKTGKAKPGIGIHSPRAERAIQDAVSGRRLRMRKRSPA